MYQQLTIVGNVGREPEMKFTPSGKPITNFSVAVNEKRGDQDTTTWIRVSCFDKLAEVTNQYLTKGRQVLCVGRVRGTAYLDKEGKPACGLEMTANTVQFLGSKGEGNPSPAPTSNEPSDIDSIPF